MGFQLTLKFGGGDCFVGTRRTYPLWHSRRHQLSATVGSPFERGVGANLVRGPLPVLF